MLSLKSNYFRTREELCDFVNNNETEITVVQIVTNSTGFILFYKEGE
jgi:hypothetical protein